MPKYDRNFYINRWEKTQTAANDVLSILFEVMEIRSVIDIGCGVGTWLNSAQKLGTKTILGIEGYWLENDLAVVDKKFVKTQDLENRIQIKSKFDLAITLEVAEHLSEMRADSFIDDLCALSDLILFSAAIPNQGGKHHVNEQWQSYWAQRFKQRGYHVYDIVRWKIWSRSDIDTWYKQNTLVYCRADSEADKALRSVSLPCADVHRLDVAHPELFARRARTRWRAKDKIRDLVKGFLCRITG